MLESDILDRLSTGFSVALDGAYGALHVYSLGLISVLGLMYLYLALGRMMSQGGTANLSALGEF